MGIVTGTAGLSLYVLGYSFGKPASSLKTFLPLLLTSHSLLRPAGPMLLAPLQELPSYGRNPIYMSTLLIYVAFVIASAVARNIETILVARFFAGFFGSPVLATGAASIADVFGNNPLMVPAAVGLYAIGAVLGVSLDPLQCFDEMTRTSALTLSLLAIRPCSQP